MTQRQILEKLKSYRVENKNKQILNDEEKAKIHLRKRKWTTYWRQNINLYIAFKLGINTYPFQHYSYYQMGEASTYFDISSRGASKTFKMSIYGLAECLLRPYSEVVLTAVTLGQASVIIEEKIKRELFSKEQLSPVLKYLYDEKYFTLSVDERGLHVNSWNGSVFTSAPCIESARGNRATILMAEECRLMKKGLFESIFKNMLRPRRAGFLDQPKYMGRTDLLEEPKTIYVTSNRYKNEWFYRDFQKTFMGYFQDKYNKDRVFCSDIFLSMKYGLKSKRWYLSEKKKMGELDFRMEVLNEVLGEAENAYFNRELFRKNQILQTAFKPLETEEVVAFINKNRKKKEDEIRLIFVDFAFTGSTSKIINDNTVIGCLSMYKKGSRYIRNVEYIETATGDKNDNSMRRIREIFYDYEADYIVYDNRNGGDLNFNEFTKEYYHKERGEKFWNKQGFTVCNEMDLHVVSKEKIAELRSRTIDPNAIPVLIPIAGTSELNTNMWQDLSKQLTNENIAFLIDDLEFNYKFEESKEYILMTDEEKAKAKLPYIQTMALINEAVNLSQQWQGANLKLTEPRTGTKDRIVALAYGNLIMTKIQNRLEKNEHDYETNIDEYDFVF